MLCGLAPTALAGPTGSTFPFLENVVCVSNVRCEGATGTHPQGEQVLLYH